jgi:hypothetical protein
MPSMTCAIFVGCSEVPKGEFGGSGLWGQRGDLAVVRYFAASALVLYRKHDAAGDGDDRQGNPQGFVGSTLTPSAR